MGDEISMTAAGKQCWTVQRLIESTRRAAGTINKPASLAIYTASNYSLAKKEKSGGIYLLDVKSGHETQVVEGKDARDPLFICESQFLYLTNKDDKSTLMKYDIANKKEVSLKRFDYTIENLQFHNSGILAYSTKVDASGSVLKPARLKEQDEAVSLVYDSLFVRHWDTWKTSARQAIFTIKPNIAADEFELSEPVNVVDHPKLESPIPPFGDASDFSLSATHVAFVSKDPDVNEAQNTASQVWIAGVDATGKPKRINSTRGASSGPVFSSDGKKLAFLEMRVPGYEADRRRAMVYDLESKTTLSVCPDWDRSPSSITWTHDNKGLYLVAEDCGMSKVFMKNIDESSLSSDPEPFSHLDHNITSISVAANGSVFVSGSSMARQMIYTMLDSRGKSTVLLLGKTDGLREASTSDFWFRCDDRHVHGWLIKPDNFDARKKYPMLFMIHGGPQGAWLNSWSTRWHPHTWANFGTSTGGDGYICVAINPTGSTSYGQKFCDDIRANWGSLPYDDLVAGFHHVLQTYPFIDPDRCVAAGASYGGYMINWIQGHDLGRKFKALICHDGVFNAPALYYTTEELFFGEHDFLGPPWADESRNLYEKWNPANFVREWKTPQLVIHSSRDYRLPETEGLAAFNVLQRLGIESRLLIFKNENHWVLKPENSLIWHEEIYKWIEAHTHK